MGELNSQISIAVSKGRIMLEALPLLVRAELSPIEDMKTSRKLLIETVNPNVKLVVVRSEDVPTYVRLGGADFGIVGKDILLELENDEFYELLDLGLSRCRLILAEKVDSDSYDSLHNGRKRRVATKYVNTARRYFAEKGIHAEVMKLTGSMELAPLCGIADRIVDLAQTGNTLKSNGLVEVETISDISARLVANKASMRLKEKLMKKIVWQIKDAL